MKDSIVLFGSYYSEEDEFAKKASQVEKLRKEGVNINLFYLLKLKKDWWGDWKLPDTNVDRLIIANIRYAINTFNPNILAFHNGLTIAENPEEFTTAIETIKRSYPKMIYLIENFNCPEKSCFFRENNDFLEWCKLNFESNHAFYDVIWKVNT